MNKNYVFFNSNKKLLYVYICCARPNGRTVRHIIFIIESQGRLYFTCPHLSWSASKTVTSLPLLVAIDCVEIDYRLTEQRKRYHRSENHQGCCWGSEWSLLRDFEESIQVVGLDFPGGFNGVCVSTSIWIHEVYGMVYREASETLRVSEL